MTDMGIQATPRTRCCNEPMKACAFPQFLTQPRHCFGMIEREFETDTYSTLYSNLRTFLTFFKSSSENQEPQSKQVVIIPQIKLNKTKQKKMKIRRAE